ncbi:MAG: hypothetical protein V1708_02375 [Candidatus Micrarchaeota archaeon]
MGDKSAAFAIGLVAVALFLYGSYFVAEKIVEPVALFNPFSLKDVLVGGISDSIDSGKPVTGVAEVYGGANLFGTELTYDFNPRRAYYAQEFASDINVSVVFECKTSACEAAGSRVDLKRSGFLSAQTACSAAGGSAKCTITFSDAPQASKERPVSMNLSANAKNPLQRQLLAQIDPEIDDILVRSRDMGKKNPLEKSALLWSGQPQSLIVDVITRLADLGVILSLTSGNSQYFYDAQKKYGLYYPDGSASATEFIGNVQGKNPPSQGTAVSTQTEGGCVSYLDAGSRFVAMAFAKLSSRLAIVPICLLDAKLQAMNEYRFSWAAKLFSFPVGESEKDQVHRAMVIRDFERQLKFRNGKGGADQYPVVAAQNQIKWLNSTGNSSASEKITFYRNSTVDFSSLRGIAGFAGTRLDTPGDFPVELQGETLKVSQNIEMYAITTRSCTPECSYSVSLSDRSG